MDAKESASLTTAFAPGAQVPNTGPDADVRDSRELEEGEKFFIFQKMREHTKSKKKQSASLCSTFCRVLGCLIPDPIEEVAAYGGREFLKATVETLNLLTTVASLDPKQLRHEINNIIGRVFPQDLQQYAFKPDVGSLPGRLTGDEMIYCARLSLLSYLTRNVKYNDFFPENREKELLDHVFGQGTGEIHQLFLVKYVSSLFEQDQKSPLFGQAVGIARGLQDMNLELIYPFDVRGTQGYIAKSVGFEEEGGDIIICFQGTVDSSDFKTSFHGTLTPFEPLWDRGNAGTCPCLQGTICAAPCENSNQKRQRIRDKPFGKVHVGFYESFLSVRDEIQTSLEILLKDIAVSKKHVRIVVTGHSLGGAIATLCTAWLMHWFRYVFPGGLPETFRVLSITFAQPKVGDSTFVKSVDDDEWTNWDFSGEKKVYAKFKTYRIFLPLDPVPTTPPVLLNFRHCYAMSMLKDGQLYFLPHSLGNEVDTTSEGIKKAIDQGMSILHFHDIFCYLDAVMHFADCTRGDKDMDDVFGIVDYQAETRKPGFLETF